MVEAKDVYLHPGYIVPKDVLLRVHGQGSSEIFLSEMIEILETIRDKVGVQINEELSIMDVVKKYNSSIKEYFGYNSSIKKYFGREKPRQKVVVG